MLRRRRQVKIKKKEELTEKDIYALQIELNNLIQLCNFMEKNIDSKA